MTDSTAEEVRRTIGARPPGGARRLRVAIPALLATVIAGLVATGVRAFGRAPAAPTYETVPASVASVRVTITATGALEALSVVEVGAEVTGRLSAVLVDANDEVKKGQLLAVIDPEQLRASAEEADAQIASADAALLQARATLVQSTQAGERAREQSARGLISRKDLETATAEEARANASVGSAVAGATLARAKLNEARSRLGKTKIVSPIDGVVLFRNVQPGQTVTSGFQTPLLFRLAQDLTQMRLNVDVNEADVGRVHPGQEASFTVDAYPDRPFTSVVQSLGNEPAKAQGVVTYRGVLSVDNHERLLRMGMTCTATILADRRENALVVPNAALRFVLREGTGPGAATDPGDDDRRGGKRRRLWVLRNGAPVAVSVRTGVTDGLVTEILGSDVDGVTAGAAVVVDEKTGP